MKALIAALLLAVASGGESGGRLFVHVSAGIQVIIDDVSAGVSTSAEGGKLVTDLAPGPHHVVVRSADGREGSFDVAIVAGQTRDVSISALGLRKKIATSADDETGSLRVVSIPDDCVINFRNSVKEKHAGDDFAVDAIPAGRYPLAVSRKSATLRTEIDVPKGTIVTVEANFTAGTIRVIDTRRRPVRLNVAEANDALRLLAVPPHWKSAIRGALPAGIDIAYATAVPGYGVKVTLRVPSDDVGISLIRSVTKSTAFVDVVAPSYPRREQNAWLLDLIFYFPASR